MNTQLYVPKSGLVRLHYPPELVANPDSPNLTFLEPMKTATLDPRSLVSVSTNLDPLSQDPSEYARATQDSRARALAGYRLLSTALGHCYKEEDGVETRWEYDESGTKMNGRACVFIHHRHAFHADVRVAPGQRHRRNAVTSDRGRDGNHGLAHARQRCVR